MAGSLNFFGAAELEGDRDAWVRRMELQLFANLIIAAVVLVVGVVLAVTVVDTRWSIAFCGALAADLVVVEWCRRRLSPERFVQVGVVMAVALWLLVIAMAALVPFALPILLFAVLVSLLGVTWLLTREQAVWFIAGGCATVMATTALALTVDSPIDAELSAAVRNAIVIVGVGAFTVPLALLAWDTHVTHAVSVGRLVDANTALRSSRARLVEVADEERRQLERNLHDGAQQRLAGLAMRMRLLGSKQPEVADDVDRLVADLQEAIEELRELAHGIYPPLLERQGLADALRAALRKAPITTEFHADEVGRFGAAIETAVYFCCLEALQNAAKYAGDGATVTVTLEADDDELVLVVADDGSGYDPEEVEHGRGVENMADRMAAIDGTLRIATAPGDGTRVTARVQHGRTVSTPGTGVQASP